MPGQSAGRWLPGIQAPSYRGADRRGIIARLANPSSSTLAVWMVAAVIAVPIAGVGVVSVAPGLPARAASTGAADAALVAFCAAALVLFLRFRLVGEAATVPLAAVAVIAGLLFVPATHLDEPVPGYVAALQMTSVLVMVGLCLAALAIPAVWAGLRPLAVIGVAVGAVIVLAIPLTFALIAIGVQRGGDGFVIASAVKGLACAAVAIPLLGRGIRGRQALFVAAGAALLSIAADSWALSYSPLAETGLWKALPALFLLVGAVELLLVTSADLRSAFSAIVLQDVRGRRRWVAAESELVRVSSSYRGQSHDIAGVLSALDGTLLALSGPRDLLSPQKSAQLVVAIREQIHQLMALLAEDRASAGSYDLSELLAGIVALHASGSQVVRSTVEPGLEATGHPDRVMRIVNNLLVNAARYAPAASVNLTARRVLHPVHGEVAELVVADHGPGLKDVELEHAFEPGWRGDSASGVGGSGLGLSQCRELAEAEGGDIVLEPTHPSGSPGERGLRARVRIPVSAPVPAANRIPNFADALREGACPNSGVVLGRALHRRGPGRPGRSS